MTTRVKRNRAAVLGIVFVLLGAPLLLAFAGAVAFGRTDGSNGTIVVGGQKREYLLHVPRSYDAGKAVPLVISLHGAAGWGAQQMRLSEWNALSDSLGFIVVYPSGADGAGPRIWHVERGAGLARDVAFISALIDTLSAQYHVDSARVYANGISNGGGMSFALSCKLSNRIAAVGLVAAAHTLPWSWCDDRRPVPMISFHGTADPLIPYAGGKRWLAPATFPNVVSWTRAWARRNHCDETPADSNVAPDVSLREYKNCESNASVVLFTLRGGGHTWPGGEALPEWAVGPTNRSVSATRELWAFFLAHPLALK